MNSSQIDAELDQPGGARWYQQLLLMITLFCCAWLLAEAAPIPSLRLLFYSHLPIWVPASTIVFWRWSWAILHWARASIYLYWTYPRLRREAEHAVLERGPVAELYVLLATFKERPESRDE